MPTSINQSTTDVVGGVETILFSFTNNTACPLSLLKIGGEGNATSSIDLFRAGNQEGSFIITNSDPNLDKKLFRAILFSSETFEVRGTHEEPFNANYNFELTYE